MRTFMVYFKDGRNQLIEATQIGPVGEGVIALRTESDTVAFFTVAEVIGVVDLIQIREKGKPLYVPGVSQVPSEPPSDAPSKVTGVPGVSGFQ